MSFVFFKKVTVPQPKAETLLSKPGQSYTTPGSIAEVKFISNKSIIRSGFQLEYKAGELLYEVLCKLRMHGKFVMHLNGLFLASWKTSLHV